MTLHLGYFALAALTAKVVAVNNGLARTPQMGWVSNLLLAGHSFEVPRLFERQYRTIGMH